MLGRNSFTCQKSWSTDTQLQFILQRSRFVDSNQVSFEIFVHRYNIFSLLCLVETALTCQRSWSTDTQLQFILQRSHFVDFNQVSFEIFVHRYNIFSLFCWVETALPVKDLGQLTHNGSSYSREVTQWILIKYLLKFLFTAGFKSCLCYFVYFHSSQYFQYKNEHMFCFLV